MVGILATPLISAVSDATQSTVAAGQTYLATVYGISNPDNFFRFSSEEVIPFDKNQVSGAAPIFALNLYEAESFKTDYHDRWWLLPPVLSLSNPKLNTNIPFNIWNTFGEEQTIDSFVINGSESLQFDIGINTFFRVGEYKEANVRILPGEPAIEADFIFQSQDGQGLLKVIASIAETFNILPELPVREIWEYKTDILTSHNGTEQRISLRSLPRIKQTFNTLIENEKTRQTQYDLVYNNVQFESLVPYYQYATNVTRISEIGETKIFLDMKRTNVRLGFFVVLLNPQNGEVVISRVVRIDEDGIALSTSLSQRVTENFIVAPCVQSLVTSGSGIVYRRFSGELQIDSDSFIEPEVLRPNATRTVGFFDGMPLLNRRPINEAEEGFVYSREVIDNEVGSRIVTSRRPHPVISGTRIFLIQRTLDPDEFDYWRSFLDYTRGSFKPFLLSTYLQDLTLVRLPDQGTGTLLINEFKYPDIYFPFETWKRIEILYKNGQRTQHVVTSANPTFSGGAEITIFPFLQQDPQFIEIEKISFLLKMRHEDLITFEHDATTTNVILRITTTDFG